jgi:hypothetical protein
MILKVTSKAIWKIESVSVRVSIALFEAVRWGFWNRNGLQL